MRCPKNDNTLVLKIPRHDAVVPLSYFECPSCYGHWITSFDANYIKSIDIESDPRESEPAGNDKAPLKLICPECRQTLESYHGDNVPPDIEMFRCPIRHGYFFPAGELRKFKEAQEIKIQYHKRWNIPLASMASTLLMTLFGLILSGGLVIGVIEGQKTQTIGSHATDIITSQNVSIDPGTQRVTFIALTQNDIDLSVTIDNNTYSMISSDHKSHILRLTSLSPGTYRYSFSYTTNNIHRTSSVYTFTIPKK